MMKLLFLAHPFPPVQAVACIRTWNIAKQLSRVGWNVTVVTPHPELRRRVLNPERFTQDVKEIGLNLVYTGLSWPWLDTDCMRSSHPRLAWAFGGLGRRILRNLGFEHEIGWAPAVRRACARFQPGSFDAILATGNPYVAFSLAQYLGERLRCPYILDYRDLWTTGNPHAQNVHPSWIRRIEQRVHCGASAVTVVSESWRQMLIKAFGRSDRVHVVSNGYDADELAKVAPYSFREPALVYAGSFYPPKRVLSPIMEALRSLDSPKYFWRFHYYGAGKNEAELAAAKAGILQRLVVHGEVPRSEALAAAKGAHCSVVITSVLESEVVADRGIVTGKIFELVGMGVPILLVAPPLSDAESVIHSCGRRYSGHQLPEIRQYLGELLLSAPRRGQPPSAFEWGPLGMEIHRILLSVLHR